ncbi:MAG: cold shock domain-containing protein [Gemmatimonadota bacterium]|nr:cold shock domain-containing protein [Gemmatimonadota bacterium]
MQNPPEIAFRNVSPSEAIQESIGDAIDRLDALDARLTSCHVMVEQVEGRQRTGNLFHVRIAMNVPGGELVVSRHPPEHRGHEDITQAIGEAFDDATRMLVESKRRRKGDVKHHQIPDHGKVRTLDVSGGFGFIETLDGQEVYFHRNAVLDRAFDHLEPGTEVRFVPEMGEKGPQASAVTAVGKHHPVG